MPLIPNVIRRGAIYYWRRRWPHQADCEGVFLSVSLWTADSRLARRRFARLTFISHDLFEYRRQGMLTDDQVTAIMRHQAREIGEFLAEQAAIDRIRGGLKPRNLLGVDPAQHGRWT